MKISIDTRFECDTIENAEALYDAIRDLVQQFNDLRNVDVSLCDIK
jgi:hypothetical protein